MDLVNFSYEYLNYIINKILIKIISYIKNKTIFYKRIKIIIMYQLI